MVDHLDLVAEARQAQRMRALALANQRRQDNKRVKIALREGKLDAYDVIAGKLADVIPDRELADRLTQLTDRWTLEHTVRSVRGVGPVRAKEILVAMSASPRARLGALTFARREKLAYLCKRSVEQKL